MCIRHTSVCASLMPKSARAAREVHAWDRGEGGVAHTHACTHTDTQTHTHTDTRARAKLPLVIGVTSCTGWVYIKAYPAACGCVHHAQNFRKTRQHTRSSTIAHIMTGSAQEAVRMMIDEPRTAAVHEM